MATIVLVRKLGFFYFSSYANVFFGTTFYQASTVTFFFENKMQTI